MPNNQFNSTANTSWTCPHNGTFVVTCWGPGGGGATYGRTTNAHGAGGGGGGAYARATVTCVKDTIYTIAVGGGGAGATSNNTNGSNGTANSHFNNNEVRAAFGYRGVVGGTGGAGGSVANSIGSTGRNAGGAGAGNAAMVGGGGGAAGSSDGTGPAGGNGAPPNGGTGNNGAGSGGSGGASNTLGSPGTIPGGGGGGAGGNLGTTIKVGGDGANGSVLITWNDFMDGATTGVSTNNVGNLLAKGKLYGSTNGIASVSGIPILPPSHISGIINSPLKLIDNFDNLVTGTINGQNKWVECGASVGYSSPEVANFSGDKRLIPHTTLYSESAAYRSDGVTGNQFAQITIDSVDNKGQIGVAVRCSGVGATSNYISYYVTNSARTLGRVINGAWTEMASVASGCSTGDILRVEVEGNTLRVYLNGSLDTALTGGTGIFDISGYPVLGSGYPGVSSYTIDIGSVESADNWESGSLSPQISGNLKGTVNISGIINGVASTVGVLKGLNLIKGIVNAPFNIFVTDDFTALNADQLSGQGNWEACVGRFDVLDVSGDKRVIHFYDLTYPVSCNKNSSFDTANQYAQVKIDLTGDLGDLIGVAVRITGTSQATSYFFATYGCPTGGGTSKVVGYMHAGTWVDLATTSASGYTNGDVIKLEITGNSLRVYINGSLDTSLGGTGVFDVTSIIGTYSQLASGKAGIAANNSNTIYLDDFEANSIGTVAVTGNLKAQSGGAIAGIINGVASISAALKGKGSLIGTINGVASCSATGKSYGRIAGPINGVASDAGDLKGKGELCSFILGSDLVTNGKFDSDANWSKGTGITITGGVLRYTVVADGVGANQASVFTVGNKYRSKFNVLNYVQGGVRIYMGATSFPAAESNGTYINIGIATSEGTLYLDSINLSGTTTLDVDNVYAWQITGVHASGIAIVSGILKGKGILLGSTNGIGSNIGILKGKGILSGIINGIGSNAGILKGKIFLSGIINGIGSNAGILKGKGILSGSINGVAIISGDCKAQTQTQKGIINGVTLLSGTMYAKGKLYGSINGISSNNGGLRIRVPILGSTVGIGSNSPKLYAKGKLYGSTIGIGSNIVSGKLYGRRIAATNGIALNAGILKGKGSLVISVNAIALLAATLKGKGKLYSTINGFAFNEGILSGKGKLQTILNAQALLSGTLSEAIPPSELIGNIYGIAYLGGTIIDLSTFVHEFKGISSLDEIDVSIEDDPKINVSLDDTIVATLD